ncbi:MAG: 50S ribosomal protein L10 [Pseudomonadota bacterium]
MDRGQKADMVDFLKGVFGEAGVVVVTRNQGLSVAEMDGLRAKMRDAGATVKVVKNRLAKIALSGTPGDAAADMFTGPTAIMFAADPVGAAKMAVAFAKDNEKLVLIGALLGETVLDEKGVEALSKMPSLDEMRAKLAGVLNQPGSRLATALSQPGEKLARVLGAPGSDLVNVLRQREAQTQDAA